MRKSVACLGLCFLLVHAGNAFGQSKPLLPGFSEPETTPTSKTPRRKLVRSMSAERLIQQRAIRQADERRSRMEARRWRGISLMRPTRQAGGAVFYSNHHLDDIPTWWGWFPRNLARYTRR